MWSEDRNASSKEEAHARYSTGSEIVLVAFGARTEAGSVARIPQFNAARSLKSKDPLRLFAGGSRLRNPSAVCWLWCVAGLSAAALVVATIVIFMKPVPPIVAPYEWFITRELWQAKRYETLGTTSVFEPLRLVVIQHTGGRECHNFYSCADEMRYMQNNSLRDCHCDIPYNFQIGNDGRIYEGRGWHREGAHTTFFNRCSVGLGFVGDYRGEVPTHSIVTPLQVNRTMMLLEQGVELGYLHPEYHVVAASDISNTFSPGSILYAEISSWEHFLNGSHFQSYLPGAIRCELIYAEYFS